MTVDQYHEAYRLCSHSFTPVSFTSLASAPGRHHEAYQNQHHLRVKQDKTVFHRFQPSFTFFPSIKAYESLDSTP